MSHTDEQTASPVPPLGDLLARYLDNQVAAQAAGLTAPNLGSEIVPFDAAPVQTVDPRLAWHEAIAALAIGKAKPVAAPPEWPMVVAGQEPVVALAFAVGNFPQMVRQFQPMLHQGRLGELRTQPGRPIAANALIAWAQRTFASDSYPQALLALGTLRLARQFDLAAELIQAHRAAVPAEWQDAFANETAALQWHRGQAEEAVTLWNQPPDSVPVLFNRGMAALFLDRPTEAVSLLERVVAALPETGAWFHLAQLYLTLARLKQ